MTPTDTDPRAPIETAPPDPAVIIAVEQFLYREARILDEWRYDDWLALWEPDADIRYWVPCGHEDVDPTREVSLIYDDRFRLQERILRLKSPAAHAQDPRSRMRRTVSNVEVAEQAGETLAVHSNFVLGEFRRDMQTTYIGHYVHHLRPIENGAFAILSKKVLLVNLDGFIGNLTFIL